VALARAPLPSYFSSLPRSPSPQSQVKLVQDFVRSVSFFYVFAVLKGIYLKKRGSIGVPANLLLGYLSATINLLFTMPVEVCNTRQMTGFSEGSIVSIVFELVRPK
jgi:hypothetical protein